MGKIERRLWKTQAWMEDTKMDLQDMGWQGVYLIHVSQDRQKWRALVNKVMGSLVA